MDAVKFEIEELIAQKNVLAPCNVTVTPLSADNFTITLEILGDDCFFVTPTGTNKKSIRTFDSKGFMVDRLCEMELLISSDKPGTTVTVLTVYTNNSEKPEIKLTIQDEAVIENEEVV